MLEVLEVLVDPAPSWGSSSTVSSPAPVSGSHPSRRAPAGRRERAPVSWCSWLSLIKRQSPCRAPGVVWRFADSGGERHEEKGQPPNRATRHGRTAHGLPTAGRSALLVLGTLVRRLGDDGTEADTVSIQVRRFRGVLMSRGESRAAFASISETGGSAGDTARRRFQLAACRTRVVTVASRSRTFLRSRWTSRRSGVTKTRTCRRAPRAILSLITVSIVATERFLWNS